MDIAFSADHRVKIKESEKIEKYLNLTRILEKLWNMKEMVVLIVIDGLGTVPKCLEKNNEEIGNHRKNRDKLNYCPVIQLEYSEESWRPEYNCCH